MRNYFIRVPDSVSASQVLGMMGPLAPSTQAKGAGAHAKPARQSRIEPQIVVGGLDESEARALERSGAQIYEDIEFEAFPKLTRKEYWRTTPNATTNSASLSLDDVLDHIRAPDAWSLQIR